MRDEVTEQSLTVMGTTIARYLRDVDPVVDVIERNNTDFRLELDYASAMRDISYWLVAKWCIRSGHPEWCDEILDEDGWPRYDDTTEPLADWFDVKLEGVTSSPGL